ncbi:hypothetical protein D3C80_1302970 [compost metagenome]
MSISPCPGKQRKWRLHSSTSMARIGASAICTKKILSPGMSRIALGSPLSDKVWKLSRITPSAGWSAWRTRFHTCW